MWFLPSDQTCHHCSVSKQYNVEMHVSSIVQQSNIWSPFFYQIWFVGNKCVPHCVVYQAWCDLSGTMFYQHENEWWTFPETSQHCDAQFQNSKEDRDQSHQFFLKQLPEDQMQEETAFVIGFKSLSFGEELSGDDMTADSKMYDEPLMSARQLSTRDVQQLNAKCTWDHFVRGSLRFFASETHDEREVPLVTTGRKSVWTVVKW